MTGLDLQRDALVELAVLVIDADLNVLGDGVDVVIEMSLDALYRWYDGSKNLFWWIDYEMTGLDLQRYALVELALLVTDADLNVLGDGVDVVIKPSRAALDQMNDVVR